MNVRVVAQHLPQTALFTHVTGGYYGRVLLGRVPVSWPQHGGFFAHVLAHRFLFFDMPRSFDSRPVSFMLHVRS